MPVSREYIQEWFDKGSHDLTTAELASKAGAPAYPIAFLLQQAAEKYLKGYLISRGWRLKKTHDLRELIARAAEFSPVFNEHTELARRLTALYIEYRYPSAPPSADLSEEIVTLLEQTQKLIALIKEETK
ncbi:MAG: HEPN domain-containing protein [Chloroflexi bacterium]|nr:HEPN domain-containing protein [Chloroflexota bacterium]